MIGTVGAVRLPPNQEDAVEIAYGILSGFWGRGFASEGLGLFVGLYWDAERVFSLSLDGFGSLGGGGGVRLGRIESRGREGGDKGEAGGED
jgi:hypothetical protein